MFDSADGCETLDSGEITFALGAVIKQSQHPSSDGTVSEMTTFQDY
jgi:hypothetical protein